MEAKVGSTDVSKSLISPKYFLYISNIHRFCAKDIFHKNCKGLFRILDYYVVNIIMLILTFDTFVHSSRGSSHSHNLLS